MRIEFGRCKGQSAERRVPRFWGRAEKRKIRHSNKNRCIRQDDMIAKYLLHYLRCDIDGFFGRGFAISIVKPTRAGKAPRMHVQITKGICFNN